MDKGFVRQWIKALRSGEYKQNRGGLKFEKRYCCLGVACDLDKDVEWRQDYASKEGNAYHALLPQSTKNKVTDRFPDDDIIISFQTLEKFEDRLIKEVDVGFIEGNWLSDSSSNAPYVLSELNDRGASFELIADLIEEEFLRDER